MRPISNARPDTSAPTWPTTPDSDGRDGARAEVRDGIVDRRTARRPSAPEGPAAPTPTSLLSERLGDGNANCLERAILSADGDDELVFMNDRFGGDGVGHVLLRDGPTGHVWDPNEGDAPTDPASWRFDSVAAWNAMQTVSSIGPLPYVEAGRLDADTARAVVETSSGGRAALVARSGDPILQGLADQLYAGAAPGRANASTAGGPPPRAAYQQVFPSGQRRKNDGPDANPDWVETPRYDYRHHELRDLYRAGAGNRDMVFGSSGTGDEEQAGSFLPWSPDGITSTNLGELADGEMLGTAGVTACGIALTKNTDGTWQYSHMNAPEDADPRKNADPRKTYRDWTGNLGGPGASTYVDRDELPVDADATRGFSSWAIGRGSEAPPDVYVRYDDTRGRPVIRQVKPPAGSLEEVDFGDPIYPADPLAVEAYTTPSSPDNGPGGAGSGGTSRGARGTPRASASANDTAPQTVVRHPLGDIRADDPEPTDTASAEGSSNAMPVIGSTGLNHRMKPTVTVDLSPLDRGQRGVDVQITDLGVDERVDAEARRYEVVVTDRGGNEYLSTISSATPFERIDVIGTKGKDKVELNFRPESSTGGLSIAPYGVAPRNVDGGKLPVNIVGRNPEDRIALNDGTRVDDARPRDDLNRRARADAESAVRLPDGYIVPRTDLQNRRPLSKVSATAMAAQAAYGLDDPPAGRSITDGFETPDGRKYRPVNPTTLGITANTKGVAFFRTREDETGEFEYVVAFKGTNKWDPSDDWADFAQGLGVIPSTRYDNALKIAQQIDESKDSALRDATFTGHSLGGGLATAAHIVTGNETYTYNPADLSRGYIDKARKWAVEGSTYADIDARWGDWGGVHGVVDRSMDPGSRLTTIVSEHDWLDTNINRGTGAWSPSVNPSGRVSGYNDMGDKYIVTTDPALGPAPKNRRRYIAWGTEAHAMSNVMDGLANAYDKPVKPRQDVPEWGAPNNGWVS